MDNVLIGLSLLAAISYLAAAARQVLALDKHQKRADKGVWMLCTVALALHGSAILRSHHLFGVDFGLYHIASLIFLVMAILSLLLMITRPLQVLIVVMLPLAALAAMVSALAPPGGTDNVLGLGLLAHIALSVISYGLLTLTAIQALFVILQNNRLKHHQTRGLIRALPPLQRMEDMFFELLAAGTLVLGGAVIAGAVFIADLFAQHLVHKTVFTLLSLAVYVLVVVGHQRQGWRIRTAVILQWLAYSLLALGFFGSKIVLEFLLAS